jgi:2'-5' RNA ligase
MTPGERWRCFVAIALGDELRRSLAAAIDGWREDPRTDGLRWVGAEALHLTLVFIGPVDVEAVGGITGRIERVAARHAPMTRAVARLGAFHRPGSARVLWSAVDDADGSLAAIATDLGTSLGLAQAEPFRAHVTLARARRRAVDLRGWIEAASAQAPAGALAVQHLDLMRSHLGGGPARYETLATFPLGGAPR